MPGTTAKPPEPCTEYDSEIAALKAWAYTYGLNVSALDPLRTAGDRAGLKAELQRLQTERFNRQAEWIAARNEVEGFASQALGFPDLVKEIEDALNNNEVKTTNYYGECISRLKAFFASLPGKLSAAKAKAGTYSAKMPAVLENGRAYLGKVNHEYSKDFFDLLNEKPKLEIRHTNKGSYCTNNGKLVVIDGDSRAAASDWYRIRVIYHEFGHAIADQRKLLFSKEVTDVRNKQITRLRKREKTTYSTTEKVWNHKTGKYELQKVKHNVNQMKIVTLSAKINNIYKRIKERKSDDPIFKRFGITKGDAIEQFCALMDTLRSLVNRDDVGWGHSVSYFKGYGMKEHEYLAHAFENAFIGNRVFQLLMPTEYAEMIVLAKSFKKP